MDHYKQLFVEKKFTLAYKNRATFEKLNYHTECVLLLQCSHNVSATITVSPCGY